MKAKAGVEYVIVDGRFLTKAELVEQWLAYRTALERIEQICSDFQDRVAAAYIANVAREALNPGGTDGE